MFASLPGVGEVLARRIHEELGVEKEAWLPVMHVVKDGWDFTALFSNTAQAHQLGKTHDWVVLYWSKDGHEGPSTVVTRASGSNAGRRVVRGRENE